MTPAIASSLPSPALLPETVLARRDIATTAPSANAGSPDASQPPRPVQPAQPADQAGAARDSTDARKDLEALRERLRNKPVDAEYAVDPDTKLVVVKLVSRADGEVIRQIPSEEVVRIAAAIDRMQGVLVDHSA